MHTKDNETIFLSACFEICTNGDLVVYKCPNQGLSPPASSSLHITFIVKLVLICLPAPQVSPFFLLVFATGILYVSQRLNTSGLWTVLCRFSSLFYSQQFSLSLSSLVNMKSTTEYESSLETWHTDSVIVRVPWLDISSNMNMGWLESENQVSCIVDYHCVRRFDELNHVVWSVFSCMVCMHVVWSVFSCMVCMRRYPWQSHMSRMSVGNRWKCKKSGIFVDWCHVLSHLLAWKPGFLERRISNSKTFRCA